MSEISIQGPSPSPRTTMSTWRLAQRLEVQVFRHDADVRPAEDDGDVHLLLDGGRRAPGLLHLGRVGGDADQVRLELVQELRQRLVFDVRVVDAHLVAAPLGHRAQIGQAPGAAIVRVSIGRRNFGLISATRKEPPYE